MKLSLLVSLYTGPGGYAELRFADPEITDAERVFAAMKASAIIQRFVNEMTSKALEGVPPTQLDPKLELVEEA
jgi:hypothetical protein